MLSITKEMLSTLEEERKKRLLDSVPETVRAILSEYFRGIAKAQDIKQVVREAVRNYEKKGKA